MIGHQKGLVAAAAVVLLVGVQLEPSGQEPDRQGPRQNPNIDRPITNENVDSTVVMLLQRLVAAYGPIANGNDLPNPYTRIEPYGEPPPGNGGEWAAVIGAEGGPDGLLYVLHRCYRNSCVGRAEPPVVKLDPTSGRRIDVWGQGLMAFPHGLHVDHDGNVWTADVGRGDVPGGHVVRKFNAGGELLMTLGQSGVAGDAPGLLREPTDVVTAPDGTIFISEGHVKNGAFARVSKYSRDGMFIAHLERFS